MVFFQSDTVAYAEQLRKPPPKGTPYSLPLPDSQKPGRSHVYRAWNTQKELLRSLDPKIGTLHDAFESTANRIPKSPCLGWRPYDPRTGSFGQFTWMDYRTVQRRRAAFGVGLVELHKKHGCTREKYGIGLWCQNRPEWQITDLACTSQSLYSVSIYDVLGPDIAEYIVNHADLHCVVASLPHIPTLLKLKPNLPTLQFIISLDPIDSGELAGHSKRTILESFAADQGISIYTIDEVERLGQSLNRPYNPPSPDDVVTINYTSGTTGHPKGVILTHENAVAAATFAIITGRQSAGDTFASYLPLAHIFERMLEQGALWAGVRIGYYHGNILELVDDLKLLRPTGFASVPRLYTRFGNVIRSSTLEQPGVKGALSRHIVATKTANLKASPPEKATAQHALWDRLWGKKIATALGLERTRILVSGSAPLDPSLHDFLRVVLGKDIVQGYGLTESYAVATSQGTSDLSSGNCGSVALPVEACLISIPEMEYSVDDQPYPRGELLLRGHTIFRGYHKNPEETAKVMTDDGWFCTGDICVIDEMGRFKIIDRRKNVLKLAQGEYISPERLEGIILSEHSYLAQAYVHGDSLQTSLIAIFGIQPDTFALFASKVLGNEIKPVTTEGLQSAMNHELIRKALLRDLDQTARKHKLSGFERIKNASLMMEPFSVENQLLTPT
ncbi:hypothetical protein V8E54_009507 [Elaphomyces granulatus]